MSRHGVSQVPVTREREIVGSLEEIGILHLLIGDPDARGRLVQDVMGPPPPVVDGAVPVQELSAYLEKPPGAVLVAGGEPGSYQIITKTDLIAALAHRNAS
jgi:cystathionine beta-synthase